MVTPHNKLNRSPPFKIETKFDETDLIVDTYERRNKISEIKQSPEKLKTFKEREQSIVKLDEINEEIK